jgi:hypothetical protein
MLRDGAITFGDLVGKLEVLRVACDSCGRAGSYRVMRLTVCRRARSFGGRDNATVRRRMM